jgi:hypothetical protein
MRREGWAGADVDEHQRTMRGAFASARADSYLVRIPGTFHIDFTDIPEVLPFTTALGLTGPIGTRRAHQLVNACTLAFFDRHLRGEPAPLLDTPAGARPDLLVEARRPRVPVTAPGTVGPRGHRGADDPSGPDRWPCPIMTTGATMPPCGTPPSPTS